ncbi:MAG: carboxymuconolactone decarboxylase family protein [Chloroflexi bacterium]|nr:carboxymuconolactone decarboxylase family protein [Chloroflexota bacterium]
MSDERLERGLKVTEKLFGRPSMLPVAEGDPANAKEFARLITEHCFADSWSRTDLDIKTKSLLTITIAATLGAESELKGHIRGALNLGITREEIVAVCIHMLGYAGAPRSVSMYRCAKEVFAQMPAKK